MNSRAIVMAFHKYTPFGGEFYEPLLDFQLKTLQRYKNEYDTLYLVDSTWQIDEAKLRGTNAEILEVDPSLRYYDAYKEALPQVEEDLVLFMDNDMVVYREDTILDVFKFLQSNAPRRPWSEFIPVFDVVSIIDTIGTMEVPLEMGNKFCPYWFATRRKLLMEYLDVDWDPDAMPYTETFGLLTEAMLKDGLRPYEMEDDKSGVLSWEPLKTEKNLGYYHVRAGSTIAYLLATKGYGNKKTYTDYLWNQPKEEILRHCGWYKYMGGDPTPILEDLNA